jgi:hypothetical protein
MNKNNKPTNETEVDANSDNLLNSIEYIKRLKLQKIVLNKILDSDSRLQSGGIFPITTNNDHSNTDNAKNQDSDKSLTNQALPIKT